jgi:hypothetical protein
MNRSEMKRIQELQWKLYVKRHLREVEQEFRFAALDRDGTVYLYAEEPSINAFGRWGTARTTNVLYADNLFDECVIWKESLVAL